MRQETIEKGIRIDIPYFEGVNGSVSNTLAKKTEFRHAENARAVETGSVEKRGGQEAVGTASDGSSFVTTENYRVIFGENDLGSSLYRISKTAISALEISVSDMLLPAGNITIDSGGGPTSSLSIVVADILAPTEYGYVTDGISGTFFPIDPLATIYRLNNGNIWEALTGKGAGFHGGAGDHTVIEKGIYFVNGLAGNRYIKANGETVLDNLDGTGNLYRSPKAKKISFYKNRIYLANYTNASGVSAPSGVMRSSYPLGIVALVSEDSATGLADAQTGVSLKITDNKYFYAENGANLYDVYRGGTLIAQITVTAVAETTITVTINDMASSYTQILSSDEIWIRGTYNGEKIYRWANNSEATGSEAKQYDTFQVSGGDNGELTMQIPIGDVLLYGNKDSLSVWNDYTLQGIDINVGCISQNGYVKSYGAVYFLHYTGIYSTNGGVPILLSQKVERYINGASKTGLENAAAGRLGRSVFFSIGDVTLYRRDGSVEKTLPDVCLEYNISETNWFIHTGFSIDQMIAYRNESTVDMMLGSGAKNTHQVKNLFVGNLDEGAEIPFRVDTNDIVVQSAYENINNPISVIIDAARGASMKCFVSLDEDDFFELDGKIVKGVSTIKIHNKDSSRGKPPPARKIAISLRDSSEQLCRLSQLSLIAIPTMADADNEQ